MQQKSIIYWPLNVIRIIVFVFVFVCVGVGGCCGIKGIFARAALLICVTGLDHQANIHASSCQECV